MHARSRLILTLCAILALGVATASADWYDDFDSYTTGQMLDGGADDDTLLRTRTPANRFPDAVRYVL